MEMLKQKRSRVSTAVGGNRQIQKQKTVPKLASECRSCSHGASNENLFMSDRGQGLTKRVTGTPMKKLLDEEMSKETVSKKRSLSVIAKLMGLDGLPSPQPTHRQQRNSSDSYPDRAATVGDRRNMKMYDHRLGKKNSLEQQEFKDVYIDPEASHVANHHCLSKHNVNSVTKEQLAWTQKRCNGREYAEIHSKHEGVGSNTDLMLDFLQQPNSLFVKHLNDQPGVSSSSLCSHIALLKPSTSLNYETYDKRWKDERQSRRNRNTGSRTKHENGLSGYCYSDHDTGPHRRDKDADLSYSWSRGTDNIHGSSRIRVMERRESDIEPTRIVVLKPNLEKIHDVTKIISSPHDRRRHAECFGISPISNINSVAEDAGSWKNKGSSIEFRSSSQKSKEAREMAREITNQIRDNICNGHTNIMYSEVRSYLRDDSFYNTFESDSASESEVILPTSRSSFEWNDRYKLSPSFVSESCTSKEAKNRMSERWKMTHGYKDIEMVGKGSTLGEMLSIPDREMRPKNVGSESACDKFASPTRWPTPSGISSMDGWRDGYLSLRSPPSFDNQNNKASICCEALADETLFIHEKIVTQGRNNGTTGNFDQRDKTTSKNVRCSKKVQSSQNGYVCDTGFADVSQDSCSIETPVEISFGKKDPTEHQLLVSYANESGSSTSAIVDAVVNNEVTMSCDSSSELLLKLPTCTFGDEDFYALDQDNSNLQELPNEKSEGSPVPLQLPGSEPEFSESSKEADHHSPVSVLDVPSIDDVSPVSDCFERVNADLHELRRHLQLLKMESGSSSEMPTLFSSDEELVKGPISNSDRWEAAYIVEVLRASGFYDTDPESFTKTWYSTESPLGPWLFLSLEKHSDNETGSSRSERKLLYDRINMALSEVFWWAMNSCPLIRPSRIVASLKLQTTEVEDQLHKVLADQEKEAAEEVLEKVLDKEMKWFGSGDYISEVGNEVGEELLNDLVFELLRE